MARMVMQSGSLEDMPLLDLLMFAVNAPFPAVLELQRGGTTRQLDFVERRLVAVQTDNPRESFLAMLVKRKALDPGQAENLGIAAETEGRDPAELVAEYGLIPAKTLALQRNLWATLILVQSFGWGEGGYTLSTDDALRVPDGPALAVNLPGAFARGVTKNVPLRLARELLSPYAQMTPRPAEPLPFSVDDFGLDADQLSFWRSLDSSHSFQELLDDSMLGPERASRLLLLMQRTGMLTLAERGESLQSDLSFDEDEPPDLITEDSLGSLGDLSLDDESSTSGGSGDLLGDGPLDMSAFTFHKGARREKTGTSHSIQKGGIRDDVSTAGRRKRPRSREDIGAQTGSRLDVLFDDLGGDSGSSPDRPRRKAAGSITGSSRTVRPPRIPKPGEAGRRSSGVSARVAAPGQRPSRSRGGPGASTGAIPTVQPVDDNAPPPGPGPIIEQEEWDNLSSKEKERVASLRSQLIRIEEVNYFEFFELSENAQPMSIKKAYFQLARRYHPDALVDEGELFSRLAEAIFAQISEAYDVLSDDEAREKYIRKHVHGEKDEDELAMEKVQAILSAEGSFKSGLRLINNGKAAAALKHFEEAVAGYGEEAEYHAYLHYTRYRLKYRVDPEASAAALTGLEQAIQLKPAAHKPYHLLGKCHLLGGDYEAAKRWIRKGLKIKADDPEAMRDYKRADDMANGIGVPTPKGGDKQGRFSGLFGRKKK